MARRVVSERGISVRLACQVFTVSETCYRYEAKKNAENEQIADWLLRLTPYDKAKRAAEDVVVEAGAKYGLHAVGLRLAMVYGLGGRRNLERMVRGRSVERSVKRGLRSINWLCLLFAGAN